MRRLLPSTIPLLLAACATSGPQSATPESLVAGLIGRWDNADQFERAPAPYRAAPGGRADGPWIDRQHVTATSPSPGRIVLEWREGGPAGPLWRTDRLTFAREGAAIRITGVREAGVRRIPLEGPCAFLVTPTSDAHFDAIIDPQICRIRGEGGRVLGYQARLTLTTTGLLAEEAGVIGEDAFAFRRPDGVPYDLRPAP